MNKKCNKKNYLDKIPIKNNHIGYDTDIDGNVILCRTNRGTANWLFQIIFCKPRYSYVHLDKIGSAVWQNIDGIKNIISIGDNLKEKFGDKTEPLYERLTVYFDYLFKGGFILFKK
ncbi:MAG: PqqD family protein [Clostridia bacterium]|nr:PqqD family protein [Clostridia bacterium]